MEQYKDLWISGHATPGCPGGYQRLDNSVVELTTLNIHNPELENREVAELRRAPPRAPTQRFDLFKRLKSRNPVATNASRRNRSL